MELSIEDELNMLERKLKQLGYDVKYPCTIGDEQKEKWIKQYGEDEVKRMRKAKKIKYASTLLKRRNTIAKRNKS